MKLVTYRGGNEMEMNGKMGVKEIGSDTPLDTPSGPVLTFRTVLCFTY